MTTTVADVARSPHARLRPLTAGAVRLNPAGELGRWQALTTASTIPHCLEQLERHGTNDNFRRLVGRSDAAFRGPHFADSDLYKTLEAMAWDDGRTGERRWAGQMQAATALLAEAQQPDGYLNSWFQGVVTDHRFDDLRWGHEMYCIGHLLQAAVAWSRSGDAPELVSVARRAADLLVATFGLGARDGVCGHPEIETGLVELYRLTRDERYLALATRMIDLRGQGLLGRDRFASSYFQDHLPLREAAEVTGHAVRQVYLAAGAADVYLETGDEGILAALRRLFRSAVQEKSYVTGGLGSRHRDESFGDPYELPAERAYAETCAAIGHVHWAWRMLLATGQSEFADALEHALYNAVAVGISTDGAHFSYSNPLQVRARHDGSDEDSPSERLEWFGCACCPPNIARLGASLHHYVATTTDDGLQVHLYSPGTLEVTDAAGSRVLASVHTKYPWEGDVLITFDERLVGTEVRLRIPGWADGFQAEVDGEPADLATSDGYAVVPGTSGGTRQIRLRLAMPVQTVVAHPYVDAVRGCVAVRRGPLVYCVEQADVEANIDDIRVAPDATFDAVWDESLQAVALQTHATVRPPGGHALYRTASSRPPEGQEDTIAVRAVPYARWGNRGVGAMRVWLPRA